MVCVAIRRPNFQLRTLRAPRTVLAVRRQLPADVRHHTGSKCAVLPRIVNVKSYTGQNRISLKPCIIQPSCFFAKRNHSLTKTVVTQRIQSFVPPSTSPTLPEFEYKLQIAFDRHLKNAHNIVMITGAGLSTESGIRDYRGVHGAYKLGHKPTTYMEFVKKENLRRRYWARNMIGYPNFSEKKPNRSHFAIAEMEKTGRISSIITQNVDGFHQQAGSKNVHELHGTNHSVICLNCKEITSRSRLQHRLEILNKDFVDVIREHPNSLQSSQPEENQDENIQRPDGDADLGRYGLEFTKFRIPDCESCGGMLKPHVVFFGENVPVERAKLVLSQVQSSDSLIILGSTLSTYSALRLVRSAHECEIPILIANIGETQGDKLALTKLNFQVGDILQSFSEKLSLWSHTTKSDLSHRF